jgi:hypothetical protein
MIGWLGFGADAPQTADESTATTSTANGDDEKVQPDTEGRKNTDAQQNIHTQATAQDAGSGSSVRDEEGSKRFEFEEGQAPSNDAAAAASQTSTAGDREEASLVPFNLAPADASEAPAQQPPYEGPVQVRPAPSMHHT